MHAVSGNVPACQRKTCLWPGIRSTQVKRRGFGLASRFAGTGSSDSGNRKMIRARAAFLPCKERCGRADDGAIETRKSRLCIIERKQDRFTERRSIGCKCLEIGLATFRIEPYRHGVARVFEEMMQSDRLERGDTNRIDAKRQSKTSRCRDTDPDARKGPRTDGHSNALDLLQRQLRLLQGTVDDGHQPFGMALADRFAHVAEHLVGGTVINAGGTINT
ncbi:hypothetical protein AT6N2_C2193 [Agrobacterium tumefaciens]|nr:hypothetical protein AT6N2_C2193 [Agrobacterium tumefaciens]